MADNQKKFVHRFIARFLVEATSPLAVGSGDSKNLNDQLVALDANGLPYIPGTSLAGVIRHSLGEEKVKDIMGSLDGNGSHLIVSSAHLVDEKGVVVEGLLHKEYLESNKFIKSFKNLPIRQHVRINHFGCCVVDGGKFDEQVVYKGSRFCFELEMVSDETDLELFREILSCLSSEILRIGSGSRRGFGEIKVKGYQATDLDLSNPDHLRQYLNKNASLNSAFPNGKPIYYQELANSGWDEYEISLTPVDYMLFGSGFGNEDANMTYVTEKVIIWESNKGEFKDENILIPASSVKGAISHRLAFHYNKKTGYFADILSEDEIIQYSVKDNPAVCALFGNDDPKNLQPGKVLFSDIIETPMKNGKIKSKLLNHIAVDGFTGGTIKGALFTEKVMYGKAQQFTLKLWVNQSVFSSDITIENNIKYAFEKTLGDMTTGLLPLGGGTNRGNGCFCGSYKIKDENYE